MIIIVESKSLEPIIMIIKVIITLVIIRSKSQIRELSLDGAFDSASVSACWMDIINSIEKL